MSADNLDDLLKEIADFWENHHLGELQILKSDSITIVVRGCYKCQFMGEEATASICSFSRAIIQSILNSKLGRPTQARTTARTFEPGIACSFELEEIHPASDSTWKASRQEAS